MHKMIHSLEHINADYAGIVGVKLESRLALYVNELQKYTALIYEMQQYWSKYRQISAPLACLGGRSR